MPSITTPFAIATFSIVGASLLGLAIYHTYHAIRAKRDAVLREQRRKNELRSLAADILNVRMLMRRNLAAMEERDLETGQAPGDSPVVAVTKHIPDSGKNVSEQSSPTKEDDDLDDDSEDTLQEVGFDWISMTSRDSVEIDLEAGQWTEIDLTRGDEEAQAPDRAQTRSPRVWVTMEPPRGF